MKTTIYDFCWTEEQGLWATENGEPTVLIEASVSECDTDSHEYEEDETYREYGAPVGEYLLAENIEYQPGDRTINDGGEVLFGEAARLFIEDRAKLSRACEAVNLGA